MKKMTSLLLVFTMMMVSAWSVSAATDSRDIYINVNGTNAQTETPPILTKEGRVLIPIRTLESLGLTYSWNSSSKTATVTDESGDEIKITVNHTTASKNGSTVTLDAPAQVLQGRTMVPVRFISEAFDSDVVWNAAERIVYVAKTDQNIKDQLASGDLNEARSAALTLPQISSLPTIEANGSNTSMLSVYFIEGQSDIFFLSQAGVISGYEVGENAAWRVWSGKLQEGSNKNPLFFLPGQGVTEEVGTRLRGQTSMVYYEISTHAGQAKYGKIDQQGNYSELGTQEMGSMGDIFPIEEENK